MINGLLGEKLDSKGLILLVKSRKYNRGVVSCVALTIRPKGGVCHG